MQGVQTGIDESNCQTFNLDFAFSSPRPMCKNTLAPPPPPPTHTHRHTHYSPPHHVYHVSTLAKVQLSILINLMWTYSTKKHSVAPRRGHLRLLVCERQRRKTSELCVLWVCVCSTRGNGWHQTSWHCWTDSERRRHQEVQRKGFYDSETELHSFVCVFWTWGPFI